MEEESILSDVSTCHHTPVPVTHRVRTCQAMEGAEQTSGSVLRDQNCCLLS